jgi:hypothetical protein
VVQVQFDAREGGYAALAQFAREEGFGVIEGQTFALDNEPQFYLRKGTMRFLPLMPAQRTAINLALPYRQDANGLLSRRQQVWLHDPRLERASDGEMYRMDIRQGWARLEAALGGPIDTVRAEPA